MGIGPLSSFDLTTFGGTTGLQTALSGLPSLSSSGPSLASLASLTPQLQAAQQAAAAMQHMHQLQTLRGLQQASAPVALQQQLDSKAEPGSGGEKDSQRRQRRYNTTKGHPPQPAWPAFAPRLAGPDPGMHAACLANAAAQNAVKPRERAAVAQAEAGDHGIAGGGGESSSHCAGASHVPLFWLSASCCVCCVQLRRNRPCGLVPPCGVNLPAASCVVCNSADRHCSLAPPCDAPASRQPHSALPLCPQWVGDQFNLTPCVSLPPALGLPQVNRLKEVQAGLLDKVALQERRASSAEDEVRRLREENGRLREELQYMRSEVRASACACVRRREGLLPSRATWAAVHRCPVVLHTRRSLCFTHVPATASLAGWRASCCCWLR